MSVSFVYFDVGDTLLHKPEVIPRITTVLHEYGFDRPEAIIRQVHVALREIIAFPAATNTDFYKTFNARMLKKLGIQPTEQLVLAIYEACRRLSWFPFNDVQSLDNIGCEIGILSNWDTSLRTKLDALVPVAFSEIVISGELGVSKPQPEIFSEALSRVGRTAAEVAMVGDSMRLDITPGSQLGWTTILYDPYDLSLSHHGHRVKRLADLPELFNDIISR